MIVQPLKWHGGKHDVAKWIISLMPPRCKNPNAPAPDDPGWLHYVEPYFGGGSVLLANDQEGISEIVNDKNDRLCHFWSCMANPVKFAAFQRHLEGMPFAQKLFSEANGHIRCDEIDRSSIDTAVAFFVACRQSLAGRMDAFAGITKNRTRRGMNEQVSAWLNCIEGLPAVHARLKRVLILSGDALDVIKKQDGPRTLFYLDPPYLHETRATTKEYGEFEMSEADHAALLNALVRVKESGGKLEGRFLLSGYHSDLYDSYAKRFGWPCHEMKINNHAAGGKTKRMMTECVWTNF